MFAQHEFQQISFTWKRGDNYYKPDLLQKQVIMIMLVKTYLCSYEYSVMRICKFPHTIYELAIRSQNSTSAFLCLTLG